MQRFHIVLHQPRIPQNTGNIGRLCFASNSILHLIYPLGFHLTQKELKRAGMDYWQHLEVYEWENLESFMSSSLLNLPHFYLTTKPKSLTIMPTYPKVLISILDAKMQD